MNSTRISTRNTASVRQETYSINPVQQALIEKQQSNIQDLEDKLRKRGKTIKDLKLQLEDAENEKKLLNLKNKHLTADLAEYKRGFSRHEGMYKQTRGRGMSRGARAPNSREVSPDSRTGGRTGGTKFGENKENRSSLRRSRSYDRPWNSGSRPVSRSNSANRVNSRNVQGGFPKMSCFGVK